MNLQRNFKAGFSSIVGLLILLCFSSIVVIERSAPDSAELFQSHIEAQASLEKILLILSALDEREPALRQTDFSSELEKLRKVVTESEPEKLEALEVLQQQYPAATKGDPVARLQVLQAVENFSTRQQASYKNASEQIRLRAVSSGWAIAFLGILGFIATLSILSRFKNRILDPLTEVISVIADWNGGNRMRRFNRQQATPELRDTIEILNDILDRSSHYRG